MYDSDRRARRVGAGNAGSLYPLTQPHATRRRTLTMVQLIGDVEALKASLAHDAPPVGLDPPLTALWWSAKTQFDTRELGADLYMAMGQPFNGGGSLEMLTDEEPDYGAPALSPRWCWGVAHSMTQTTDFGFRVQATRDPEDSSTWGDARLNWVHGFLHRLEQDDRNAESWYGRGFKPLASGLAVASGEGFETEWETIATELLASQRISPRSFMCSFSTAAAAIIGDLDAPPLPITLDPDDHTFTYSGETYDKLIEVAEVLPGGAIADESHAVAFVAGLYLWHGLWDEAHALLLGSGSPHHPKLPAPCSTRSYMHAILHRIEGVMDNEGGTPGYRNSEYWSVSFSLRLSLSPPGSVPNHFRLCLSILTAVRLLVFSALRRLILLRAGTATPEMTTQSCRSWGALRAALEARKSPAARTQTAASIHSVRAANAAKPPVLPRVRSQEKISRALP